jgi:hypothetical protein
LVVAEAGGMIGQLVDQLDEALLALAGLRTE